MSLATLERLPAANDALSVRVETDLLAVMSVIDLSRPDMAKGALFEAIPPLVNKWGDVAATASAEWFEEFRLAEGVSGEFRSELADPVPTEQVNARLGFATREAGHLFLGQSADLFAFLSLIVNEYSLKPGHETVALNAQRDGAAYARIPEPGACKFCVMLASRGFVYSKRSAEATSAGGDFHGKCRCHGMPVYDETRARVEYGYSPEALLEQYRALK